MKRKLATSLAFTKNFFVTGAIKETSRNVEIEICKHISKEDHKTIVEFGIGHGNITRQILKSMSKTSTLYAFEVNKEFCNHVRKAIPDSRLIIINDSAEHILNHINIEIDNVISSIPFSFFGKEKGMTIISDSYELLTNDGFFSQVLYTKFNFKKFHKTFEHCSIKSFGKTIKEHVIHCQKHLSE